MSLKTKIVKIDASSIDYGILNEAAEIVRLGGLVVFPTDTVYGIGTNIYMEKACLNIFKAKNRPADNPLIAHINCLKHVEDLALSVSDDAYNIIEKFWPGALTLIFKKKKTVSDIITAGLDSIGMRIPNNKITTELIRLAGVPIAGTSANISGKLSPTNVSHVIDDLYGKVDMIIDGGSTKIGLESTVMLMNNNQPAIVRSGSINDEDIKHKCGINVLNKFKNAKTDTISPGQKYNKYKHNNSIVAYKGSILKSVKLMLEDIEKYNNSGLKIGVLCSSQTQVYYKKYDMLELKVLGNRELPQQLSLNLFESLREFERKKVDIVLVEPFYKGKDYDAIYSRIIKACDKEKIASKLKILVLCTENTCVSSFVESILYKYAKKIDANISIKSSSVSAQFSMDSRHSVAQVLGEKDINFINQVTIPINYDIIKEADIVLTTTIKQKNDIVNGYREFFDKVYTINELYNDNIEKNISNPYGKSLDDYRRCRDELIDKLKVVFEKIY